MRGPLAEQIKPGTVSNEMIAHHDWLPTFLAMAGDPEVRNLLKGHTIGDMTYKVHLDGHNLVPYLTGQVEKSPREWFLYCNDDQQLVALRRNWKFVFAEQREPGTMKVWSEPFVTLHAYPSCSICAPTPSSAPTSRRSAYYDWFINHVFLLVPAQAFVGQFLQTFRKYPQRQKAASFNLDDVLRKMQESTHT